MIEVPASQPAWKLLLLLLVGLVELETHRLLEEDLHGPGSEAALQTSSWIPFFHYFDIFNSLYLLSESGGTCFRNCPFFPSSAGRRGSHMIFIFLTFPIQFLCFKNNIWIWLFLHCSFHFGRAALLLASLWLQLLFVWKKFWIKAWESSSPGLHSFPLSLWLWLSVSWTVVKGWKAQATCSIPVSPGCWPPSSLSHSLTSLLDTWHILWHHCHSHDKWSTTGWTLYVV